MKVMVKLKQQTPLLKSIQIYTDGSCLGNPGPGGYGIVLIYGSHRKELAQGYQLTTNNRMELLAAIIALESLKEPCQIELWTDSQYVRQGILHWLANWKQKNWRTSQKKAVKNVDLWQRLDQAQARHTINWHWVKGHSGQPENERCDQLARQAAETGPYLTDIGYEVAAAP